MAELPGQLLLLTTLKLISNAAPGLTHVRGTSARILSHIIQRYIVLLGSAMQTQAEHCGRTHVTVQDALTALADFGFNEGLLTSLAQNASQANNNAGSIVQDGLTELSDISQLLYVRSKGESARADMLKIYDYRQPNELETVTVEEGYSKEYRLFNSEIEDDNETSGDEEPVVNEYQFNYEPSSSEEEEDRQMVIVEPPNKKRRKSSQRWASIYRLNQILPDITDTSKWNCSLAEIPSHIPAHFPPLPGMEKETFIEATAHSADDEIVRMESSQDKEQQVNLVRKDRQGGGLKQVSSAAHMDPWRHIVQFDRSHLAEKDVNAEVARFPVLPPVASTSRTTLEEDEEIEKRSSLLAYFEAHRELAHKNPVTEMVYKTERRKDAASRLDHFKPHQNASFSLFSAFNPESTARSSKMSAGWLPYPLRLDPQEADPVLHPVDSDKIFLNSFSVPLTRPQPATRSSVIPRSISMAADLIPYLADKTSHAFFSKMTRMAPPGPLGKQGETLPYVLQTVEGFDPTNLSKVQEGRTVQYGFEWRANDFTSEELPKPSLKPKEDAIIQLGQSTSVPIVLDEPTINVENPRAPNGEMAPPSVHESPKRGGLHIHISAAALSNSLLAPQSMLDGQFTTSPSMITPVADRLLSATYWRHDAMPFHFDSNASTELSPSSSLLLPAYHPKESSFASVEPEVLGTNQLEMPSSLRQESTTVEEGAAYQVVSEVNGHAPLISEDPTSSASHGWGRDATEIPVVLKEVIEPQGQELPQDIDMEPVASSSLTSLHVPAVTEVQSPQRKPFSLKITLKPPSQPVPIPIGAEQEVTPLQSPLPLAYSNGSSTPSLFEPSRSASPTIVQEPVAQPPSPPKTFSLKLKLGSLKPPAPVQTLQPPVPSSTEEKGMDIDQ